jgi:uronate dehydrogenase
MLNRLLITGAAGGLGKVSRERLKGFAKTLRLSDVSPMGEAAPHEELVPCDLGDKAAVHALVDGCDGILHLGGVSVEDTFDKILNANIVGATNLYEAARKTLKPRILFASSNHAVGFYRQSEVIDASVRLRPDGLYGLSKYYGEGLASLYHDKFGIETAIVRIGSCFSEPKDQRMLKTWLSYDDYIALVERVFTVETLGLPVIYGMSNNEGVFWDNSLAASLGWTPKDSSAQFRDKVMSGPAPDPNDAMMLYHGGRFCTDGIHES